ncbi:MAG: PAS domain S-box protein [Planctomycetes bacterium]|nr:PAS domain S-box protein [Planctomycetota bacterium]
MRFSIGAKLGALASALIVGTVLILTGWMLSWSRAALTRHEQLALADETMLRGGELVYATQALREDALCQAARLPLQEYLRAPAARRDELRRRVEEDFAALLSARTHYLQVEYLPLAPPAGGPPAVRANRREEDIHVDSAAHRKHFPNLAASRDNSVHLSAVRRNADVRQGGKDVPVLRAAAPLFVADERRDGQRLAGALVVTLDFRPLARALERSARYLTYLTDEEGRFLVHPDPGEAFAFERDASAPRISDRLLPKLAPLYKQADPPGVTIGAGASLKEVLRPRGFRHPDAPEPWSPGEIYYLLDLRAIDPNDWKDQRDVQKRLDARLEELLGKEKGLAASGVSALHLVTTLRSKDRSQVTKARDALLREFDKHLAAGQLVECKTYVVHFYRLAYSAPDVDPPRWFGLAQALSHEEIVADVTEQTTGLVWIKLALIVSGVGLAFLVSRRLTRPLQRITAATRNLARGDFNVELPVSASDEIGVLARCFKDMVEQLRQRGQQLRENEARLRTVLRTAAEGIFILDADGQIQMVNHAAEKIFGYSADELKGQNVKLLLPKEVQGLPDKDNRSADAPPDMVSTIKLGRVNNSTQEVVGRRKDGSVFPLELSVSDVSTADGRLYTGIVRDITERKRAEHEIRELNQHLRDLNDQLDRRVRERTRQLQQTNEDLAAARDQALEASRAKSNFLAQMSHELRTPLNAIKGYSELLLEESQERGLDDLVPDLNRIIEAGKHLLALINDILDLSKIEAHKIELFLETFDVKAMGDALVSTVAPLLKKNKNQLSVRFGEGVGSIYADRTRVRQVLFNLLSNATKFTHDGRVQLEVVRETWEGRDAIAFHVRDSGIGISAEQMDKLFKPFSQADDSTTRKYGGTGLGLAISRSFCQMMGGDITVRSEPGKGSDFTAHLPVQVTDARAVRVTEGTMPSGKPDRDHGAGTVLVVDDDPAVRDLMQRYLDREGFRVVAAANGHEGLRLARQLRPAAITLDVLMPGMDGWDVLTALKADPGTADIPVIMLTIADDRNLGHALGAAEYMTKPIDRDRLTGLLRQYRTNGAGERGV